MVFCANKACTWVHSMGTKRIEEILTSKCIIFDFLSFEVEGVPKIIEEKWSWLNEGIIVAIFG